MPAFAQISWCWQVWAPRRQSGPQLTKSSRKARTSERKVGQSVTERGLKAWGGHKNLPQHDQTDYDAQQITARKGEAKFKRGPLEVVGQIVINTCSDNLGHAIRLQWRLTVGFQSDVIKRHVAASSSMVIWLDHKLGGFGQYFACNRPWYTDGITMHMEVYCSSSFEATSLVKVGHPNRSLKNYQCSTGWTFHHRFAPALVLMSGNSLATSRESLPVLVFAGAAPQHVSPSSGKNSVSRPKSLWEVAAIASSPKELGRFSGDEGGRENKGAGSWYSHARMFPGENANVLHCACSTYLPGVMVCAWSQGTAQPAGIPGFPALWFSRSPLPHCWMSVSILVPRCAFEQRDAFNLNCLLWKLARVLILEPWEPPAISCGFLLCFAPKT